MNAPTLTPGAWLAVGAVGLGALYLMRGQATTIAAGAVGAVADAGAGVVLGTGDVLGVPRTNQTQCQKDLSAGRTWEASFSCPAGTFIKEGIGGAISDAWGGLWGSVGGTEVETWGREVRTPAYTGGASASW